MSLFFLIILFTAKRPLDLPVTVKVYPDSLIECPIMDVGLLVRTVRVLNL